MILLTAGMGLTFMMKQQSHAGKARAHADAAPVEDTGPCTAPAAEWVADSNAVAPPVMPLSSA